VKTQKHKTSRGLYTHQTCNNEILKLKTVNIKTVNKTLLLPVAVTVPLYQEINSVSMTTSYRVA